MDTEGRAMQGAIAEKSYLVAENKISPVVEMTRACHFDQTGGILHMTLGDNNPDTGGISLSRCLWKILLSVVQANTFQAY